MKLKTLAAVLALSCSALHAQTVEVTHAWVRSTVAGQKGSGAFMKITASESARLVGMAARVAGMAEVHEMKMEGDVMKMHAVPVLELPAGCAVERKPGGYPSC